MADELKLFINETIEPDRTIITNGWCGYSFLSDSENFKHDTKTISGSGKQAHELLHHIHMVDSLLKRWINGYHQGNVSHKHLAYYLDEFAFRFSRKLLTYREKFFYSLIQQALSKPPKP